MKKRILVVTSSRADFGILSNLINLIKNDKSLILELIVTGSHLSKKKNSSISEINNQKIKIKKILKINFKNNNLSDTVSIFTKSITKFKKTYDLIKPNLILILGDRFEIFASALAAFFYRIPIAHIHGGEVTYGAFDEAIRHSITKLSNFHFVTNKEHYKRVNQLGENPKNIYLVGSLSSENIKKNVNKTKSQIEEKFNLNLKKINLLITFHPVTLQKNFGKKDFVKMLNVLKNYKEYGIIFTSSNIDVANNFFKKETKKFVQNNNNAYLIESFGKDYYFSTLKIINCMIGNSSSGILESSAFKLPVINLGNRQEGRSKNKNIINLKSNFTESEFRRKLNYAISLNFKKKLRNLQDSNYRGNSSHKILKIIKNLNFNKVNLKKFYDIKF